MSRRFPAAPYAALPLALAAVLAGCAATPQAGAPAAPAGHAFRAAIDGADFAAHVRTLASDEFGGRAPGSAGEERTVEYLAAQFGRMGLAPGNQGSWFQTVPMVETTADPATTLTLEVRGKPRTLAFGTDMVVGTRTAKPQVKLDASQLVFVGYGVNAPERGWNDYAGLDVRGKTVVILVNDPGFHTQDAALFDGKAMTYYGRWTYKFEEAARQGAAGALIVHDDLGAAYGWDVVKNSWSGAQFDLRASDDPEPRLPVQGWITQAQAKSLFADLGLELDALYRQASRKGFRAIPLDARASVDLRSSVAEKSSRNVVARLPGRTRPDEAIVYMAHWDHLGDHGHEGHGEATPADDAIYNGAIDNATGVAGILEIAEAFASRPRRPERSLVFVAVTLEESGLLGSKYYVANPAVPLKNTVAVVNLDAMPVTPRARDMTVIGYGNSELEDLLAAAAKSQGRVLTPEPTPEHGYYFRSDHFNFAKAGVPALYAKGGDDLVEGGVEAGRTIAQAYRAERYHKPSDEFDPAWTYEGVVLDLQALYAVGEVLADGPAWPRWRDGNAFRAAQERLRGAR
ncbi:M28 family metallopeptidase [Lysobacter sp. N42]|uniref:M28 family metallopeptidase n=1 Tax=Lysobacter sp. N42 TaxID=2545719 RepID=UPI00104B6A17|nr:M28 family metallopeptidase [Lysobacter sp. N42]TCZ79068.1 M20/M25/M40 family metallo-hydrolase [Lysobacter sp. N42]